MTVLANDRLLVNVLVDCFRANAVPTLLRALKINRESGYTGRPFLSNARLSGCKDARKKSSRACHRVELEIEIEKPVSLTYHTEHIVSTTGAERLEQGAEQSIVGLLHDMEDHFEIEPLVIGTPLFMHSQNPPVHPGTLFNGTIWSCGEIEPKDIKEFSRLAEVEVASAEEWMNTMKALPESEIKEAFAKLLKDPTKKDWGGEKNDHFSAHVTLGGQRRSAAFLLKGPAKFKEMTMAMCGKNADQVHRLVDSGADISIVQHCHMIGEIVRRVLRDTVSQPGAPANGVARKYCFVDGKDTYRILRAYGLLGACREK